jgi:hypothetical protein
MWLAGIALIFASQTATAQVWNPDEHGNDKVSGSWDFPMPVDCYGDTLNIHMDWDLTVHTTANPGNGRRWMFTQNWNMSGYATDSQGNEWTLNGHWQATEVSTENWGVKTDFHNSENYILRSKTATNLLWRIKTMIQVRDYELVVENSSQEWFCLQD